MTERDGQGREERHATFPWRRLIAALAVVTASGGPAAARQARPEPWPSTTRSPASWSLAGASSTSRPAASATRWSGSTGSAGPGRRRLLSRPLAAGDRPVRGGDRGVPPPPRACGRRRAAGEIALDEAIALLDGGDPAGAERLLAGYIEWAPDDPSPPRCSAWRSLDRAAPTRRRGCSRGRIAGSGGAVGRPAQAGDRPVGPGPGDGLGSRRAAGRPLGAGRRAALGRAGAPSSAMPAGWGRPAGTDVAADRRWNLALLTGYEYDTNVALAPSIPLNGLGAFDRPSSRWTLASFGEYRIVQRPNAVLGLIGSTYDAFQFRLDPLQHPGLHGRHLRQRRLPATSSSATATSSTRPCSTASSSRSSTG